MPKLKVSAQEGRALVLALIVLGVGSLLLATFLAYISTNLLASRGIEERMKEQYASDAGVEYAIGQLLHNPSFFSSVITIGVTTVITVPTPVNNIAPISITVTNSGIGFRAGGASVDYVMWSNSATCEEGIYVPADGVTFEGNIHTNSDIKIAANIAEMTGTLEYVTDYEVPQNMQFHPPEGNPKQVPISTTPPITLSIAHYRPGGGVATLAENEGKYYHIQSCGGDCYDEFGVQKVGEMRVIPTGLYYVESGDVYLESRNLTGTVTIVAEEGKIEVGGRDAYLSSYCGDNVLLFSNKQNAGCTENVVKFWGRDATWHGIIYGLGGHVWAEGAHKGVFSMFGNTIRAEGAGSEMGLSPSGYNPPCAVFHITSVADETRTEARVLLCSGVAYVVSWEIKVLPLS